MIAKTRIAAALLCLIASAMLIAMIETPRRIVPRCLPRQRGQRERLSSLSRASMARMAGVVSLPGPSATTMCKPPSSILVSIGAASRVMLRRVK